MRNCAGGSLSRTLKYLTPRMHAHQSLIMPVWVVSVPASMFPFMGGAVHESWHYQVLLHRQVLI